MREKLDRALEELRRKLRGLIEAVDDALSPPPDLVPVPIDPRPRPPRR